MLKKLKILLKNIDTNNHTATGARTNNLYKIPDLALNLLHNEHKK